MRALLGRVLSLGVVATLSLPSVVAAEIPLGGFSLSGDVVAGERYYLDEPSRQRRGKFDEYRDNQDGIFLDRLNLHLARPDEGYAADLGGSKWGHIDQDYYLGAGRLGLWQFGFEWDQTPHVYSSTGRTLYNEVARNIFTLRTPRPSLPTWDTSSHDLGEIEQRWDTAHVFLAVTPTPDLDIRADYTRIYKTGERPFGMAFGSPGNNFAEILAPIDQTMHDVRLRATYATDSWQVQGGYTFSLFHNEFKSVTADNPCFGLTASLAAGGCAGDATGAQTTGRVSLDPDNMAHTFNLGGGVNLPMRSRLTANFTYSLRLQDANFLPQTINPAVASSPLLALPRRSLGGLVGTTLLNVMGTTRPLQPLTLTLRYRFYDYNDMSNTIRFPAEIVNDRAPITVGNLTAARLDYTRHNADLDGRWRFGQPLALTLGGGWEHWDRSDTREVPHSDEYYAKAAIDATPLDWLLARLTVRPAWRRISSYNTEAPNVAMFGAGLTLTQIQQGQSFLLRKFDEGDRNRQSVDLLVQVTPLDSLSNSVTVGWREDDYIDSPLGLKEATTWSAGFDTTWRPGDRLAVYAGYLHELIFQKQESRFRTVVGAATIDTTDFDWISDSIDTVDTVHVGTSITLIPRALAWNTTASYSYALGQVDTRNPSAVLSTIAGAANATTATAKRFPAFEDGLFRIDSTLQYHFAKVWTASVGYAFESFQKHDWRTDTLNPFVPGVSSIWMGNDWRNYSAHSLIAKIGYRF